MAGEPITWPGFAPRFLHLAALDAGDVGLVFKDHDNDVTYHDVTRSTVLATPFAVWPPAVAPVLDQHFGDYYNSPGTFSALGDGTFALGTPIGGVFRFDQVGPTHALIESVDLFLDPTGGAWTHDGSIDALQHRDAAWTAGPPLSGFLPAPCNYRPRFAYNGSTTLISTSTYWGCWESEPAVARVFSLTASVATPTVDLALPFYPHKNQLVARPSGGFYLNLSTDGPGDASSAGQIVYRLDEAGAIVEPVQVPPAESSPFYNRDLAVWRDGFVMTNRSSVGIGVMVGDGTHLSKSELLDPFLLAESMAELPMLASPDGDSVLLALPSIHEVLIARFDCVSLE